jgi:hypothetical protein
MAFKFLKQIARTEADCPFGELQRTRTEVLQEYHAALAELETTVVGRRFLEAARQLQTLEEGPPEDARQYMREVIEAHKDWSRN